jgi:rubrerythrin
MQPQVMPTQNMQPQVMPMQNMQPKVMPTQNMQPQVMPAQNMQSKVMPVQCVPNMADMQQYIYPANVPEALQLITGALAGEREDRLFYEYLISTAPSEEDKEIIRGIRDNEIHHFELFRIIYCQMTGQLPPSPKDTPFVKPASYCAGIRKALLGEESAVIRYRKILFAMQNRIHINMLTEIITDELRHGTLYSYLYSKNGCKV